MTWAAGEGRRPPRSAAGLRGTPQLISRGGLVAALDRAVSRKVTIIAAPAGSGKTSLLRAWAERPGRPYRVAAVQVQRDQQDGQLFWLALLDAVRQASGTGEAEPAAATPSFNGRAVVDRVLAELASHPDGVIVVVDDLHELNSPEASALLSRLLTCLPDRVHAVLATRHDPQLGLHQLRLAGELAEIGAADLQFSVGEAQALLEGSGVALSHDTVALLHDRTEGWAAGLRLAAIALADHPDPERFVMEFSGSDRAVAEYLLAEMLNRQSTEVQDLLLRTSLLDGVNGELADLLTGRPGTERILLELEDANAFVVSLDPHRTWFRYHHLFADLLRLQLRRRLPEELPALHLRAAAWFSEHGQIVDAVRHTQAAREWTNAAQLLADHAFGLMLDGQAPTMQALLKVFPPGASRSHAELAVVQAIVDLAQGHLDETAAHLATAESYAQQASPERRRRLGVAIASLQLWLARRRGDHPGAIKQAAVLTAAFAAQPDTDVALSTDLRALTLMNLGTVEAWSARLTDGERHLQEGAALARRTGRPYLELGCLGALGFASAFHSFAVAQRRCHEAITLAGQHGWAAEWMVAPAQIFLASIMTCMGDYDAAEPWLQRAAQILQTDTGPGVWMLQHLATGMLHAGRNQHHQALAEFTAAQDLQHQLPSVHTLANQITGWTLATQARLGMTGQARAALAALTDERTKTGEIHNAHAAICLAEGNPGAALDTLRDVLDGTAPVIHDLHLAEAHLLQAFAHRALGDEHAQHAAVERALALAEPDTLILPFAVNGAAELLHTLPRHHTAHAGLREHIIDVLHGTHRAVDDQLPLPPIEQLSLSELKVLRYLPTNLTRRQIASELSVSVHTVNTHVSNIYTKLQARDRASAVQRARALRLLSTGPTR